MTLVLINGISNAGKDSFVGYCQEYVQRRFVDREVTNVHSSDPAKHALSMLGYIEGDRKYPEVRNLLADMIIVSNRLWNSAFKYVDKHVIVSKPNDVVFVHERDPDNIEKFKSLYDISKGSCIQRCDVITMLMIRPDNTLPEGVSNVIDTNPLINEYQYDITIDNNGALKDLKDKAHEFMESILSRRR